MGKAEVQTQDLAGKLLATLNTKTPTKAQMAELREAMKTAPALVETLGDRSRDVKALVIGTLAGGAGSRAVIEAKANSLAKRLRAEGSSPLEELLIDQVVIAWLRWQHAELAYHATFAGQSVPLAKASYMEKHLTTAQGRHLRAIESLARVRRLLSRAPVQVNIAQQQIVQNG